MNRTPEQTAEILRARARALSELPEADAPVGAMLEVLEFGLAQERYAVERLFVQGVTPLRDLTPLPGTPPFVRGIVNVRGRIVPVYDLKRFFHLPEKGVGDLHRIILVRGEDFEVGLLADIVVGLRRVPHGELHPALPTLGGIDVAYLKGITPGGCIVLDLARALADPRLLVNDEAEF